MASEAQLIARIREEVAQFAVEALRKPSQRDAFEYGYRAGVLAGLERAEALLLKIIREENERDI